MTARLDFSPLLSASCAALGSCSSLLRGVEYVKEPWCGSLLLPLKK